MLVRVPSSSSFFFSLSALSRVHPLMLWMLSFKSKPRFLHPWRSGHVHHKTLEYQLLLRWTFFSKLFLAFQTLLPSVSTFHSRDFLTPCLLTWIRLVSSIALFKWAPTCSKLVNVLLGNELLSITLSFGLFLLTSPSKSLKLGIVPGPTSSPGSCQPLVYNVSSFSWNDKRSRQGKESSVLTRSCLNPLGGASTPGMLLKTLHLYNIERMDSPSLRAALSTCPSLLDLEIVGLHVELRQTLMSVIENCPLIERLFFESSKTGRDDSLKSPTCVDLVQKCPRLVSLALRGFKLHDYKVRILVKGLRRLKYVDFSTSYSITGSFLRNLGNNIGGNLLEVLILRDCMHLKEMEVARFMTSLLAGDFKFLRHLDISNREGLASEDDWYERCYNSSIIPIEQVVKERPDVCLLADFPSEGSYFEIEQMLESEVNSDTSLPTQLSSDTSDSMFISSSESSYNSDQGSGNEDGRDAGYVIFEESSDEVDYLAL
ncbi:F-box protein At4g02760 isoform X2 [Cucumis sativus]|uniref:F-box protein At4g02760 isoform X2 n=1 Tax=Cucumis sativus TaxID=3659 RepID=UPI0012F4CF39|nr:F-box protein At4g02760 isoform X2 [Cucumis sativus]